MRSSPNGDSPTATADEDFTVRVQRDGAVHRLIAQGTLTATGGELLHSAIATVSRPGRQLIADLAQVTGVDPAGWAWLLPALQHCRDGGCELSIVPPTSCTLDTDPQPASAPPADCARLRFYPDGPVLVRGDVELIGRDGQELPRARSVVALCRCGASAIKPFCDGSHKVVGFTDL